MTIAPRGSSSNNSSKRQHRDSSLPLLPAEVVGEILALYDSHQHWLRFRLAMCEVELNAFELRAGQFSDHDGMLYPSLIMQIVRFDDRRACPIQLATAVVARAERVRAVCQHGPAYTMLGHQGVVVELQRLAPTLERGLKLAGHSRQQTAMYFIPCTLFTIARSEVLHVGSHTTPSGLDFHISHTTDMRRNICDNMYIQINHLK